MRVIWARFTQLGFKYLDKGSLQTSSGTASRLAQKLVFSEVRTRHHQHWEKWTVDVRKAFLTGISNEELAAATREPFRVVNFELAPDAVEIIPTLPGFEDFNPVTEVLSNIRPSTGNVDASRYFGMKLDQAFAKFGAASWVHDRHLRVRRFSNHGKRIDCECTGHVNDIKVGCDYITLCQMVQCFEGVFERDSGKSPSIISPNVAPNFL